MSESSMECAHLHDPGPFPVVDLGGREIVWKRWVEGIRSLCRGGPGDCVCGFAGPPWVTYGVVYPLPGETALLDVVVDSKRQPGRGYIVSRERSCEPFARLWAFKCPACRVVDVYDKGWSGDEWEEIGDGNVVD